MSETWKEAYGFSLYEVSTEGNVRSIKTKRILKHRIFGEGKYPQVRITNDFGLPRDVSVARLVYSTFKTEEYLSYRETRKKVMVYFKNYPSCRLEDLTLNEKECDTSNYSIAAHERTESPNGGDDIIRELPDGYVECDNGCYIGRDGNVLKEASYVRVKGKDGNIRTYRDIEMPDGVGEKYKIFSRVNISNKRRNLLYVKSFVKLDGVTDFIVNDCEDVNDIKVSFQISKSIKDLELL